MPPTIITPNTTKLAGKYFTSRTARSEALSLYREIIRTARAFHWCDERGRPWNERLRDEARKEFEQSKLETDPLILAQMVVKGRDCVQNVQMRFNEANSQAWKRIERDTSRK